MTDQTEHVLTEEQKAELARKAKLLVPSFVELDTGAKPTEDIEPAAPESPVKSDLMWLHPIELIKGLFSSLRAPEDKGYSPGSIPDFLVNIGDRCFFDTGSDLLSEDTMTRLQQQAEWAKKYNISNLTVEGHCDSAEGTREYCLELGERRAQAAKDYMSKFYDPTRIHIMSYGKERLLDLNPSNENRGVNRRIVTIIP